MRRREDCSTDYEFHAPYPMPRIQAIECLEDLQNEMRWAGMTAEEEEEEGFSDYNDFTNEELLDEVCLSGIIHDENITEVVDANVPEIQLSEL